MVIGAKKKYAQKFLALLTLLVMATTSIALWKGFISADWLASFGYKGIFLLSLINSVSPIAGPSQMATFIVAAKLNPLLVGIAGGVGGAIGEVSGYLFGYFARGSVSDDSDRTFQRIGNWRFLRFSREHSFVTLFLLASIPNPFFDPVSAVAGSLRIGLRKYFFPVVLGRTTRHVVIAYAGFHFSSWRSRLLTSETMSPLVDSLLFLAVVILIAFAAWLVRLFAESEPDPLILNLTFFAFVEQCILSREMVKVINPLGVIALLFLAFVLVLLQVKVVQWHATITTWWYRSILTESKAQDCKPEDVEHWASALVRITGLDFYPQLYSLSSHDFSGGPRGKRRQEALLVLPENLFERGDEKINLTRLTVPEHSRKWPWRAYAGVCLASWLMFLGSLVVVIVRTRKL